MWTFTLFGSYTPGFCLSPMLSNAARPSLFARCPGFGTHSGIRFGSYCPKNQCWPDTLSPNQVLRWWVSRLAHLPSLNPILSPCRNCHVALWHLGYKATNAAPFSRTCSSSNLCLPSPIFGSALTLRKKMTGLS